MPTGSRAAVAAFAPETNEVILDNGERIAYRMLVAAPGIKLDWGAIEGLPETLGKKRRHMSNYRFDLAPYTWRLVQEFRGGRALFTQPPCRIKSQRRPAEGALSFLRSLVPERSSPRTRDSSSFTPRVACFSASRIMSRR